jgi:hypothetical protein
MPLRNSYELPDSGISDRGGLHSDSKLERLYRRLLVVYGILHILYWLAVGGFIILLPWYPFWDSNVLTFRYPALQPVMSSPFTKGAAVGLGVLNLMIGLYEILHFGRPKPDPHA